MSFFFFAGFLHDLVSFNPTLTPPVSCGAQIRDVLAKVFGVSLAAEVTANLHVSACIYYA